MCLCSWASHAVVSQAAELPTLAFGNPEQVPIGIILGLSWGYMRIMENTMETIIV